MSKTQEPDPFVGRLVLSVHYNISLVPSRSPSASSYHTHGTKGHVPRSHWQACLNTTLSNRAALPMYQETKTTGKVQSEAVDYRGGDLPTICSGVLFFLSRAFVSAPQSSNNETISGLGLRQETWSGVRPFEFFAPTSALQLMIDQVHETSEW